MIHKLVDDVAFFAFSSLRNEGSRYEHLDVDNAPNPIRARARRSIDFLATDISQSFMLSTSKRFKEDLSDL